ncbi:radical SAM family heme chaperone HemW [Leptolyngbya sp. BC1307]|uniref:radical SAM family heme chaperone HemW n=1 Tax=Leptolyngbya sp. BC1307 TaxID=2029589 RepID=UPI000EFBB703|nr:radical SAM family heme chaperone HemW [Leptolyngbya sp. BC1307]
MITAIIGCGFAIAPFIAFFVILLSETSPRSIARDWSRDWFKSPPATSAYVHIPFCRRRCFYCDFAVTVVGQHKRGDTSGTMAQYVETLIAEIRATPAAGAALKTVFFGGGTPSLLSVPQLEAILHALAQRFGIAPTAEISMEMDPATFERDHLQGYRAAGVNRVSLGVQAFQDHVLAASGRFHRRGDIFHAVELLQQAQIANFSFDLISGLPHQTDDDWQVSLEQAIALNPTHLSHYDLIVEPQTAFARYFSPGEAPLPSDEATAQMYRTAQTLLTDSGYDHYEICNYAKPGYEARHNLTYWRAQPCYGFGMGATSYLNHQRIDRPRTQRTYRQWVADFVAQGGQASDPVLPLSERVLESIMVGLRLKQGISLAGVNQVYGEVGLKALEKAIAPHIRQQWVIVEPDADVPFGQNVTKFKPTSRIRLSDPEGFLMSNQVIVDAFNALEAL